MAGDTDTSEDGRSSGRDGSRDWGDWRGWDDDGVRQPRAEAGIDPKKDSNDDISRNDPVNWYPDGRKYKKY